MGSVGFSDLLLLWMRERNPPFEQHDFGRRQTGWTYAKTMWLHEAHVPNKAYKSKPTDQTGFTLNCRIVADTKSRAWMIYKHYPTEQTRLLYRAAYKKIRNVQHWASQQWHNNLKTKLTGRSGVPDNGGVASNNNKVSNQMIPFLLSTRLMILLPLEMQRKMKFWLPAFLEPPPAAPCPS